jgi:hypothetical protein
MIDDATTCDMRVLDKMSSKGCASSHDEHRWASGVANYLRKVIYDLRPLNYLCRPLRDDAAPCAHVDAVDIRNLVASDLLSTKTRPAENLVNGNILVSS